MRKLKQRIQITQSATQPLGKELGFKLISKNNTVCHTHTPPPPPPPLTSCELTDGQMESSWPLAKRSLSLLCHSFTGNESQLQDWPWSTHPSENEVRPLRRSSSKLFAEHRLLRHLLLWIQNYFAIRGRNLETVDSPEHAISHSNSESTFLESKRQNQRS